MKKGFYTVIAAQGFSSLADNALFVVAISLISQLDGPEWMTPAMKWFFAFAYVVLAAIVGAIADSFPKGRVMFVTNLIKILGCSLMFVSAFLPVFESIPDLRSYIICYAYGLVGIGAAAYSPAKYGIITELLPPEDLVKGNSWIEGLTVISIILGFFLGGQLLKEDTSQWLLSNPYITLFAQSPAEAALVVIMLMYIAAALFNLSIPKTNIIYPAQEKNITKLIKTFGGYVRILWLDKVGQISLAVTTLFWGAGATLQLIVLKWGESHLGYSLADSSILMGISAIGMILGATLASKVPLNKAISVLPVGVLMGFAVMLMIIVKETWEVNALLILIGVLSGFFVVPMNALLQHRGHVLLSAGHSIAVQNFNEQLNILVMVAIYLALTSINLSIYAIIIIFGSIVSVLMLFMIYWCRINQKKYPQAFAEIGDTGHGKSLH